MEQFPFGKHRGESIADVYEGDLDYLYRFMASKAWMYYPALLQEIRRHLIRMGHNVEGVVQVEQTTAPSRRRSFCQACMPTGTLYIALMTLWGEDRPSGAHPARLHYLPENAESFGRWPGEYVVDEPKKDGVYEVVTIGETIHYYPGEAKDPAHKYHRNQSHFLLCEGTWHRIDSRGAAIEILKGATVACGGRVIEPAVNKPLEPIGETLHRLRKAVQALAEERDMSLYRWQSWQAGRQRKRVVYALAGSSRKPDTPKRATGERVAFEVCNPPNGVESAAKLAEEDLKRSQHVVERNALQDLLGKLEREG